MTVCGTSTGVRDAHVADSDLLSSCTYSLHGSDVGAIYNTITLVCTFGLLIVLVVENGSVYSSHVSA